MRHKAKTDVSVNPHLHIIKKNGDYQAYSSDYRLLGTFNSLNEAMNVLKDKEPRMTIHLHDQTGRVIREINNKKTKVIDLRDKSAKPKRIVRKARILNGK